jgi:hypothetical protein
LRYTPVAAIDFEKVAKLTVSSTKAGLYPNRKRREADGQQNQKNVPYN